jgi:hypothetical protein
MVTARVEPIRAWQGVIQPFETDTAAREAVRLLALDQPVDVSGGRITAPPDANWMMPNPAEPRLVGCNIAFDLLVLEFEPPAHPWVFSLSPAISKLTFPYHPHLRTDRGVHLPSRTINGFCVYSAAEFTFDSALPMIPQFLNQVSVFLAKHVAWCKTQRLFNVVTGEMIHDGVGREQNGVPPNSIWQIHPTDQWIGFWPGKVAANGRDHLKLDPEGECWCGRGGKYKDCCRPEEAKLWGDLT